MQVGYDGVGLHVTRNIMSRNGGGMHVMICSKPFPQNWQFVEYSYMFPCEAWVLAESECWQLDCMILHVPSPVTVTVIQGHPRSKFVGISGRRWRFSIRVFFLQESGRNLWEEFVPHIEVSGIKPMIHPMIMVSHENAWGWQKRLESSGIFWNLWGIPCVHLRPD